MASRSSWPARCGTMGRYPTSSPRWSKPSGACAALHDVRIALMLSTMLHSIATGNMLPAGVRTVCVDINPAVVTKLADRGSWQSVGLVTDVESFLRELALVMETGRHG